MNDPRSSWALYGMVAAGLLVSTDYFFAWRGAPVKNLPALVQFFFVVQHLLIGALIAYAIAAFRMRRRSHKST